MPAQAGNQEREGMDTGFRRYDGIFVPIRLSGPTCTCIFERATVATLAGFISSGSRTIPSRVQQWSRNKTIDSRIASGLASPLLAGSDACIQRFDPGDFVGAFPSSCFCPS
jgi:hypothetical protein